MSPFIMFIILYLFLAAVSFFSAHRGDSTPVELELSLIRSTIFAAAVTYFIVAGAQ